MYVCLFSGRGTAPEAVAAAAGAGLAGATHATRRATAAATAIAMVGPTPQEPSVTAPHLPLLRPASGSCFLVVSVVPANIRSGVSADVTAQAGATAGAAAPQ